VKTTVSAKTILHGVETIVLFQFVQITLLVRHVLQILVVVGVVPLNNASQEQPHRPLRPPFVQLDNGLIIIALAILPVSTELVLAVNALVLLVSPATIVLSRLIVTVIPFLQENQSPNSMFAMFVEEMEVLVSDVMEFPMVWSMINAEFVVVMEQLVGIVVVLRQLVKPVPNQKIAFGVLPQLLKTLELEPPL